MCFALTWGLLTHPLRLPPYDAFSAKRWRNKDDARQIRMTIDQFMGGYKAAWESRDGSRFCALFAIDGVYHNTPFAEQRGHAKLAKYWERVKLQTDINVAYEILASWGNGGLAHWHVTYQVASEELFQIWAASTGTNVVTRKPGDPLPRMALDGILQARFDGDLCSECRIWWHSMAMA
jgi:hypothetical protein